MTRLTLSLDSASADEARAFLLAYQRALTEDDKVGLPDGDIAWDQPTVKVMGLGWHITTPSISVETAAELMRDFAPVPDTTGSTSGYSDTDECLTCGVHISDPHDKSCAAPAAVAQREEDERHCLLVGNLGENADDCTTHGHVFQ